VFSACSAVGGASGAAFRLRPGLQLASAGSAKRAAANRAAGASPLRPCGLGPAQGLAVAAPPAAAVDSRHAAARRAWNRARCRCGGFPRWLRKRFPRFAPAVPFGVAHRRAQRRHFAEHKNCIHTQMRL